jgi:putative transposase
MPCRDSSPVDLKNQFVADYLRDVLSISERSRQYNISRKTAYKWIDRNIEEGSSGLVERFCRAD